MYDALLNVWSIYSCAPRLRENWSEDNKTLGQCSITAFLAQDIFGGKVYGIPRPDGSFHCYNVVNGVIFDLTSEQFGDEVLNYKDNPEQFREVHFSNEEKKERYEYLCEELQYYLASNVKKDSNYCIIKLLFVSFVAFLYFLSLVIINENVLVETIVLIPSYKSTLVSVLETTFSPNSVTLKLNQVP